MKRTRARVVGAAIAVFALVSVLGTVGSTAGVASERAVHQTTTVYDWPKYAHDQSDTGLTTDPALSTANAAQLGVKWMAPNQTDMESSPVVDGSTGLSEDLVYSANQSGGFTAYNGSTGAVVWSRNLGSPIISTPIVDSPYVWVTRMYAPEVFKLNAVTGAIVCHSSPLEGFDEATPTIATPPGGSQTVYVGIDGISASGPIYAIKSSDCSTEWTFNKYNSNAGTWDPYSYGVDARGRGLMIFGTDNPDSSVYALNANTGALVWSFKGLNPANGDVGTGASITAPGVNGFTDGVAYISNNGGFTYALDLTTGALIWKFDWAAYNGGTLPGPPRGTAAVAGNMVLVPGPTGVMGLNATTGAVAWSWNSPQPSDSAAAVAGPPGQQVVAVTDLSGNLDVLSVQTGALLYQHNTGGFGVTSVAEAAGNFYVASGSGFLYDFAVGGSNSAGPTGAITSPAPGSQLANPNGSVQITGTASGASVAAVNVAVQTGGSNGTWWNAATGTWGSGFDFNPATLASPGASSTTWSFPLPVPVGGGSYQVQVTAVDSDGQADISGYASAPGASHETFSVNYLASAPHLAVTGSNWVAPGASIAVTGSGFSANESVAIALAGQTLATVTASASGSFSTSVPIPATAAFGLSSLVATGATSGSSSSAAIEVSNEWVGAGESSLHTGYEGNDLTWFQHFVGSHGQYVTQAWSYSAGAAITAQPAVVDDVAYFGNSSGTVTAVYVRNSEPLWTYNAGSAIDSTPAVASGLVIFGTVAGKIDAVSKSSGALVWSMTAPSAVRSSPAVATGLVFVGSHDGTVYAINQSTGAVKWHVKVAGAVGDSPTVDPSTNEVIVGDASGAVTARSLKTGGQLWSKAVGGAVDATTTVSNGDVFVGSETGNIAALNETTGATVWTYKAGAGIAGPGSFFTDNRQQPAYLVGDSAGNTYFLNLANGSLIRKIAGTSAVTGTSAAFGWAVISYASGLVIADKFNDELTWEFQSTASESPVTMLNGVIYVAGQDTMLRAFTVPGTQIP
jgi:outer membrane protein assembly factor BamB